jgi:hypothetical protein
MTRIARGCVCSSWCAAGLLAWLAIASSASAQTTEAPAIAPIEVLTCNFAEGKGPTDIDALARGFNQWMERTHAPEYAAYTLMPLSHSDEIDFDLAWIGAWPDGLTMGQSMAHYFAEGAELGPLFNGVMKCGTNRNFSVVTLREPLDGGRFGPLEVSTCTLRVGAAMNDALQAVRQWVDYTGTTGSTAAQWLLFPAYGERSDANYNFKWAVGYASYEAFGREYDQATNGDGLDHYNSLIGGLLRCDSPRLYAVRPIRLPQK